MSQTCQRVVIINKGRVVAVDTPDNLTARLRGSETMYVQVDAGGADAAAALAQRAGRHARRRGRSPRRRRRLRSRQRDAAATSAASWRAPSSRSGWGLLELRPMRMSLEDIFLSLTTEDADAPTRPAVAGGGRP